MTNLDSDEEEGGHLVGVKTLVVDLLGADCSSSLSDEMIIIASSIVSGTSIVHVHFIQIRQTVETNVARRAT